MNSLPLDLSVAVPGRCRTSIQSDMPIVSRQSCRSGRRTTRPSSSGSILIWQDKRLFGSGGHAIQQRVFFVGHGREAADPVLVDIHMAGGAHCISAALRHDLVDAMSRRGQHGTLANTRFNALGPVVGADESNDRHWVQTGLRVMGRLSK